MGETPAQRAAAQKAAREAAAAAQARRNAKIDNGLRNLGNRKK